jgi:hypothetical protein
VKEKVECSSYAISTASEKEYGMWMNHESDEPLRNEIFRICALHG